ncbi:MAG: c-type cytochrome [Moorea sp. SIO1F2]|uniref:cytochrome c6 PetJ n=1 Tax=unclassified Moorena TaxID=2683338 RepID=UPI0013B9CE8C|nr:c-type cytochrome [Moorena sp. SIO3I7]NEO05291.1 c-type cytochrome [Moorena sp. SIO3I8]NEO19196.1 c-type cytochrome [Moorena sp. SIO4A5]NEP21549.1 c-type cytochrome [Moorena sp. SIO3I6]NEQ57818.1 c-type cytochrome [Moorena sp. SIO4A1]NET85846.1 c-type cytochrome [Moorena sp. SIO1F2]
MKKLLSILLTATVWFTFALFRPALAGDAVQGAQVFSQNCAACHIGGNNVIMANKTLKKPVLKRYKMYDLEKIKTQVTNGKNAMPSFNKKLTEQEIENVAIYVLSQADNDWQLGKDIPIQKSPKSKSPELGVEASEKPVNQDKTDTLKPKKRSFWRSFF